MERVPIEKARDEDRIDFQVLYGGFMDWHVPEVQARRHAAELCEILVPDYVPLDFITDFPNG